MKLKYCPECGTKLIMKNHIMEGETLYCPTCNAYRFPVYSTAVSMIVMNKNKDRILLIKQYNRPYNVLVAGYVNKGESAIEALIREIKEETGLEVIDYEFNDSKYYAPTETLMINFMAVVKDMNLHTNEEIDDYQWYTKEVAIQQIKPDSLASYFLNHYLKKM